MAQHRNDSEVSRKRITKWMMDAKPVDSNPSWTERRQAIDIGGHTYIISKGQIFQCAHCGHFDPEYSAVEVVNFFAENLGIKPYDIDITCTVALASDDE